MFLLLYARFKQQLIHVILGIHLPVKSRLELNLEPHNVVYTVSDRHIVGNSGNSDLSVGRKLYDYLTFKDCLYQWVNPLQVYLMLDHYLSAIFPIVLQLYCCSLLLMLIVEDRNLDNQNLLLRGILSGLYL